MAPDPLALLPARFLSFLIRAVSFSKAVRECCVLLMCEVRSYDGSEIRMLERIRVLTKTKETSNH